METSELELTELVLVCVNQWPYTALDMTHMQCLMVCNCVFIKLYVKVCNCALSKILNSKTVFSSVPGDLLPTPGYCNLGDLKKIKTVTSKVGKIPHCLLILTSASKLWNLFVNCLKRMQEMLCTSQNQSQLPCICRIQSQKIVSCNDTPYTVLDDLETFAIIDSVP